MHAFPNPFKETLTITFTANDILRTGYFHFDLYGIDAYMEIGFTGISNASASKYPINSMPPRANIKEPEPDKAKRIVCNPSGERKFPYLCSRKTRKHADFIQEKKP